MFIFIKRFLLLSQQCYKMVYTVIWLTCYMFKHQPAMSLGNRYIYKWKLRRQNVWLNNHHDIELTTLLKKKNFKEACDLHVNDFVIIAPFHFTYSNLRCHDHFVKLLFYQIYYRKQLILRILSHTLLLSRSLSSGNEIQWRSIL